MNGSIRRDPRHDAMARGRFPSTQPACRRPTALLIDGEPAQAIRHASRLRADGYSVVSATGLEAGLEMASRRAPDLVFVCLGSWAVPAIVLLALRSDPATRGLPTVLVADRSRLELAREVGGLLPTEHVVAPQAGAATPREELPRPGRRARCSRVGRYGLWGA